MSWKSMSGMLTANHSAIGLRSNSFSARWRRVDIQFGSPFHHEIWSMTPSFSPLTGLNAYSMSASFQPRLYLLRSRSKVDIRDSVRGDRRHVSGSARTVELAL